MNNTIPQDQNKPIQLERLAAQRYLYSTAKRMLLLQVGLDLLTPIVSAVLIAFFTNLDVWGAVIGVVVFFIDLILEGLEDTKREQAASIQELFDCDVLHIEHQDLIAKDSPDRETIVEAAEGYKRADPVHARLKDWYAPIVGTIPLHLARLVCQRTNCWWDAQLRRRYAIRLAIGLAVIFLFVFGFSFINGFTIPKFFLAVAAPLIPTFSWGLREWRNQRKAANRLDGLKKHAEDVWKDTINKKLPQKELEKRSRTLQDKIYDNRSNNPLVPDFFYKRLLSKNETQMNVKAEELVDEALKSLSKNNP